MKKLPKNRINILIACEESQAEALAFRARGFNAFSCDLKPARFRDDWHILGDVTPLLQGETSFTTADGKHHHVSRWHLIIAHPPCTYLCKVGAVWLVKHGEIDPVRLKQGEQAAEFFRLCLDAAAPYVAVENPLPMARFNLPRPSCFIHPSWFGVKYTKKTLYWLKNLPPIMARIEHPAPRCFVTASRGKYRSRTFPQVAEALADQWGETVYHDLNC